MYQNMSMGLLSLQIKGQQLSGAEDKTNAVHMEPWKLKLGSLLLLQLRQWDIVENRLKLTEHL